MSRLVIDACIAHSAGESQHPTSSRCREFLEAVRASPDCRCVFTPELKEEWKKHRSNFAWKWQSSMYSRRRVMDLPAGVGPLSTESLMQCAAAIAKSDPARQELAAEALAKDAYLVNAALRTDRRVASLDEKMRGYLRVCAKHDGRFSEIVWVNPVREEEQACRWVGDGLPHDRLRTLGAG